MLCYLSLDDLCKEFMVSFRDILVQFINEKWVTQSLDKTGIINLLCKHIFLSKTQWRPIAMLGKLYEILAKAISVRLQSHLRKHIHARPIGFIETSIFDTSYYAFRSGIGPAL